MSHTYQLTGRLEEGELAELYKARRQPGTDVVIKLFHPRTSDRFYARDLADTAQRLGTLRHPGIVSYLDIGFVQQRLAVVREHVDGFSLGTALQRLQTKEVLLPSPIALFLVIQLLEATQQAHDAGLVHGAITPGNVLLSRAGVPSLCDFGALRALMMVAQLREAFANRGRRAYRALEVTRGEMPGEQADIYSLGAIAYELLTLREPVVAGGGLSTRTGGLPAPSRLDRRLNSRLDPIILRALDGSPQRRFRSCTEFAGALRNFLAASGGMPGTEELRRFAAELFPNEVHLASLGPVPFSTPFSLTPMTGVDLDLSAAAAEIFDKSVVARPSFSLPALTEEEASSDTQDAPPAFEDFKPPEPQPQTPAPAPQPKSVSGMEWEAPPGAAPPKPARRQLVPLGGEGDSVQPTRTGRNARLKVVEDFSVPLPEEENVPLGESRVPPSLVRARLAEQPPSASRAAAPANSELNVPAVLTAVFSPESRGAPPAPSRPEVPQPAATLESLPAAGPQRPTAMRRVLDNLQRRRWRAVTLAGAIALVGLISLFVAMEEGPRSAPELRHGPPPDPKADAVSGPLKDYLEQQKKQQQEAEAAEKAEKAPPAPQPAPPRTVKSTRPAPVPADSAFLTLRTNVPVRVSIDGVRITRGLPLTRYPLKPGARSISLEAVGTSQRREFSLRFTKGQHRVLQENFNVPRRR